MLEIAVSDFGCDAQDLAGCACCNAVSLAEPESARNQDSDVRGIGLRLRHPRLFETGVRRRQ